MFKLNVFDVSAFVYKGTTSQNYGTRTYYGYPVGGIHYLMRYVATSLVQSDSVVLMFDGRNNFRRSVYLDYKANRVCNPAVASQIESLWDGLSASGIPCYKRDGYEADDLISWCVNSVKDDFSEVLIYGNDKDLIHNVQSKVSFRSIAVGTNNISVANFPYSIYAGENIPFNFMSVYKVFNGCKSDNVKPFVSENGVKGRDIYQYYLDMFEKCNVPFTYQNTTNPILLTRFIDKLNLSDRDKDELKKRIKVIFPAENPGMTFDTKNVFTLKKDALRKFLTQYNDVETLRCLEYSKYTLDEEDKDIIKKKARDLDTGAYAVDRNLSVNNDIESEMLYLKGF